MKFTAPVVALLAVGTQAQIATVKGVLSDVQSGIKDLDSTVKSFSGDSKPLISSSEELVSTINDGEGKVSGIKELTLAEALQLQEPVKQLTSTAETLVDDLKSKKSAIAKGGFCDETREQITDINDSSNSLINAVVKKVPEDAQSIADSLVADLKKVLADAQSSFSESNCVNTGGDDGGDGDDSTTTEEPTSGPTDTGAPTQTGAEPTETGAEPTETGAEPTESGYPAPTESSESAAPTTVATVTTPPAGNPTPPANGTSTPPPVTAGAASLFPAGALALGLAALAL